MAGPAELAASASGPIWMPSHPAASSQNLTGSWNCGGTATLVFDNGITVEFDQDWNVPDPGKRWTEMAQQWGRGHVEEILGQPAFVQPTGEKDPFGESYRGQVLVIVGTTLIRAHGNKELLDNELVDVVNTIDVGRPVNAISTE